MRRRAGIGAIQKKNLEQEKYRGKGTELQENQLEQMSRQMDVFRVNLEEFASKHKHDIKSNPQFRRQFQEMCAAIGVDPLTSGKGFWSVLGIGDFYYELAVQIIEVCIATSPKNGGLITLEELRRRLIRARGQRKEHQEITLDDLLRAAKKLKVLGAGFSVVPVSKGQYLVQSVPGELSMDHTAVLHAASIKDKAYVSVSMLMNSLSWERERAQKALDYMIKQGLAWIDRQDPKEELTNNKPKVTMSEEATDSPEEEIVNNDIENQDVEEADNEDEEETEAAENAEPVDDDNAEAVDGDNAEEGNEEVDNGDEEEPEDTAQDNENDNEVENDQSDETIDIENNENTDETLDTQNNEITEED
ncbi:UNVERIFIED_CONTAM: hypothetical protein PYX00_007637 [Menopon gallinae]|uniref:Vacuolar-sorting protein SNF8 n=1 Tax=Menopon gallinae TaxID=328185 RepID=A0AAW2HJT8_9NEOP